MVVFFKCLSEDEKIIHIDNQNILVNEVLEEMVYHGLEDGWAVCHSVEHDSEFKDSTMGGEHSFSIVFRKDLEIIVTIVKVKLGEDLGTIEIVNKVRDEEEGIGIVNCPSIKVSIVLNHVFVAILLRNKKDG